MVNVPTWVTQVEAQVDRDLAELNAANPHGVSPESAESAKVLFANAFQIAQRPGGLHGWWRGDRQLCAEREMHEGEVLLILMLEGEELKAHARDIVALADGLITDRDPRLAAVKKGLDTNDQQLSAVAVAHLARAVHDAQDELAAQSRGFRNRLIRLTALAAVALVGLLTAFAFNAIPLQIKQSAGSSYLQVGLLVSLLGAIGALVVGVPPLARMGGTWNPFSLPWYQMLLKVMLGPVFAIVGVLLLQAHLIPNVTFPMPLADLLVWALIFGAGQQAVTSAVDTRIKGIVASPSAPRQTSKSR